MHKLNHTSLLKIIIVHLITTLHNESTEVQTLGVIRIQL